MFQSMDEKKLHDFPRSQFDPGKFENKLRFAQKFFVEKL